MSVATAIASWWRYRGDNGQSEKEKRFTKLVINMPSSGHVDIKELDFLGYPKLAGWSLPVVVMEALTKELLRRETLGTGDPVDQEHGD